MDVSKQNEEDGNSMYLSFDTTTNSESLSSRSSSTYQTTAFGDELTSSSDLLEIEDSKGNTTLHNTEKENEMSGIMKDCISATNDMVIDKKPFMFAHILKEFNAMSSTPSKISSPMETVRSCPSKDLLPDQVHESSLEHFIGAKDLLPKKLQEPLEYSSAVQDLLPDKLHESLESSSSAEDLLSAQVHESSLEHFIGAKDLLPKKVQETLEHSSVAKDLLPDKLHESLESSSSSKDFLSDQVHESSLEHFIGNKDLLPKKLQEPLENSSVAKDLLPDKFQESLESSSSAKDFLSNQVNVSSLEHFIGAKDLLPKKLQEPLEHSSVAKYLLPDTLYASLESSSSVKDLLPDQVHDSLEHFIGAKDLLPKNSNDSLKNSSSFKDLLLDKLHESSESSSSTKDLMFHKSHKPLERGPVNLNAVYNNLVLGYEQENKENLLLCDSEDSMPSFSKSSILNLQRLNNAPPAPPPPAPAKPALSKKYKAEFENTLESLKKQFEPTVVLLKNKTLEKKVKMNSAVRKTICEPNLQTNRPSRIVPTKKTRFSFAINEQNIGDVNDAIRQDPVRPPAPPLQKTTVAPVSLTSSESHSPRNIMKEKLKKPVDENAKPKTVDVTRKSLSSVRTFAAAGGRKSIAFNTQNDKRPTPKRMPPILKTTLNCATRKASRTSVSGNNNTAVTKRRSVLLLQSKLMQSPLRNRNKTSSDNSSNDRFIAHVNKEMAERGSPVKRTANARKSLYIDRPDAVKFACTECGNSYHVKSLLEAHKKTHRAASPDNTQRHQRSVGGGVVNNITAGSIHQCRFCDKNFVLERTLHIHLLQHCPKIPAAERRKLNFTEMDHVKKEETPHFRVPQAARPIYRPMAVHMVKDRLSNLPVVRKPAELTKVQNNARVAAGGDKKNNDEVKNNSQNMSPSRRAANKQAQMAPPQQPSTKVKKRSAHTGVYRTPNKDIPCVSCKQNFKSVLDYTNHMMATHATLEASIHSASGAVE